MKGAKREIPQATALQRLLDPLRGHLIRRGEAQEEIIVEGVLALHVLPTGRYPIRQASFLPLRFSREDALVYRSRLRGIRYAEIARVQAVGAAHEGDQTNRITIPTGQLWGGPNEKTVPQVRQRGLLDEKTVPPVRRRGLTKEKTTPRILRNGLFLPEFDPVARQIVRRSLRRVVGNGRRGGGGIVRSAHPGEKIQPRVLCSPTLKEDS